MRMFIENVSRGRMEKTRQWRSFDQLSSDELSHFLTIVCQSHVLLSFFPYPFITTISISLLVKFLDQIF